MPIYEYICSNCNLKFELLRPLSQANEATSCPRCHNNTRRIFSSFNAFSGGEEGVSTALAGNGSCSTCSATSCATCGK